MKVAGAVHDHGRIAQDFHRVLERQLLDDG